jgi:atypical dual specificity phosphatase
MIFFRRALIVCIGLVLFIGCGDSGDPATTTTQPATEGDSSPEAESVGISTEFTWIVPGELAVMPAPGRDRSLEKDAAFLEQNGIQILVSLTQEAPDAGTLNSHSIEQRHIPIQDYAPPTMQQMNEFTTIVEDAVENGQPVGVHCTAGLGRSGTMAAAYLVAKGHPPDEAIRMVRRARPGSIENAAQEDAVYQFDED